MNTDDRSTSARWEHTTTLQTRRYEALPIDSGTFVLEVSPELVILNKPTGDGGIKRPTIDICRCTAMKYECTTDPNGNTICKEVCTAWECTTMPAIGPEVRLGPGRLRGLVHSVPWHPLLRGSSSGASGGHACSSFPR